MADEEKNHIMQDLIHRKRKLLELREELRLKSLCMQMNVTGEGTCSPVTPQCNELRSISPPPYSPLTPLVQDKKNARRVQDVLHSEKIQSMSPPLGVCFTNDNKEVENQDPVSSPIRPMSPETQKLFDDLTESELNNDEVIENSDDSVLDPDFTINKGKQITINESETDCESLCEEVQRKIIADGVETQENTAHRTNLSDERIEQESNNTVVQNQIIIEEAIDNEENITDTRKKKGKSRKEKEESKERRNTGKSYISESGKIVPERQSKELGKCRLKCDERISRAERLKCFEEYWKLGNRERRAAFVSKSITILPKKSQTTNSRTINRECYCVYNLLISHEEKKTCKECFCRILGETKGFVNIVIEKKKLSPTGIIEEDARGRQPPKNKKSIDDLSSAREHILSFPSYESHYCRKSTSKRYLPSDLSIAKMYRIYRETVSNPISLTLYSKCFHDLKLSFKPPSKDTCNTCDMLNAKIKIADEDNKNKLIAELTEHQSKAEKAYNEKRIDKNIAKSDSTIKVFAFDLQQCLPTPYLKTSVSFYKRQLWTFNLTIHDLATNNATCYMWDETIGARGANQIGSCLWHFCNKLPAEVKEVVFYSDTSGGQNKNSIVASMFLFLVNSHPTLQTINHKFLISGHTHMECDSDHAIIEKVKKRTQMKINHLYDWVQLVRSCKVKNDFEVVVMTLEDFLDFSELKGKKGPFSLKKNDDSGEKFLWKPIKWLQYHKSSFGKILFKHSLDRESDFDSINLKKRGKKSNVESFKLTQISNEPLSISLEKKKDLLDVLDLIDEPFRNFYRQIKTNNDDPTDPDIDVEDPDFEFDDE